MLAVRCGGAGAGAHLTAQRITTARSGNGRGTVLAAGTGARELTHRVSFSPCSHPHRIGASWPSVVRCSPGPSPDIEDRPVIKNKRDEAWEALKAEMVDMFRPLLRNVAEICSLRRAYDLEDYQIGMVFGAFLGCVGCYQLWKTAPSIFVDVLLAFMFYKLSVISSELHKRRKSNSLITRLKFVVPLSHIFGDSLHHLLNVGTILIMVLKDIKKNYVLLDAIRMPVFLLYICAFLFDVAGVKKYGRRGLIYFVNLLKNRGGIQEIYRIMLYPGYISPYDDSVDWLRDS